MLVGLLAVGECCLPAMPREEGHRLKCFDGLGERGADRKARQQEEEEPFAYRAPRWSG
jgi:hypothetical protein